LIIVKLTSWQITHFNQANGQKMKSINAQKPLWLMLYPIIAVGNANMMFGNVIGLNE
jgi:hypothetical protein